MCVTLVDRVDLSAWLAREMREEGGSDVPAFVDGLDGVSLGIAGLAGTDTPRHQHAAAAQEIVPIIPELPLKKHDQQRSRHKQKTLVTMKAQASVDATSESASRAPVFAVDIDGRAFERMVSSSDWLTNDKEFAKLRDAVEITKRDYVSTVRRTILKHVDGRKLFWLFSLRDDRSCLVTHHH